MPVLCDFTLIRDNDAVTIGDADDTWQATFNTGGRESGSPAFLIFNVRGLTATNVNVVVEINDEEVGQIRRYGGDGDINNNWYTQMIAFSGSTLNNGNNEIKIQAVSWPGAEEGDLYDDFQLKDVVCFFHQSA